MTRPEEALARARAAAAAARAEGAYADDVRGFAIEPTDAVTTERLLEWALVEPDPDLVYSTRRLGAPITWVKRALMRGLRQYHGQMLAQQTRFNIQLTVYATELEERVQELEARLAAVEASAAGGAGAVGGSVAGGGDAGAARASGTERGDS